MRLEVLWVCSENIKVTTAIRGMYRVLIQSAAEGSVKAFLQDELLLLCVFLIQGRII